VKNRVTKSDSLLIHDSSSITHHSSPKNKTMKLFLLFIPLLCINCISVVFKESNCCEMKTREKEVKVVKTSSFQIIPANLLIQM